MIELLTQANVDDVLEAVDLTKNTTETVNHPSHYNREGGIECIDEMISVFGVEAVKNFCLCNVWKYRYRASSKNGEEDLKKSDFYMNYYIKLKESKNTCEKKPTKYTLDPLN